MDRHKSRLSRDILAHYLVMVKHDPTVIQIMQLRRNYYRRLKSLKYDIYELYPSARRAYHPIGLAVKTKSTPFNKELT